MKAVAVCTSVYGLCRTYTGPISMSYFTNLSNIFLDIVLFVFLIKNIRSLRSGQEKKHSKRLVCGQVYGGNQYHIDISYLHDPAGTHRCRRFSACVFQQRSGKFLRTFCGTCFGNFVAPTGWFGFDLSLMGSETLGIGVAYNIVAITILFSGIGALFLVVKDARRRKIMGENS